MGMSTRVAAATTVAALCLVASCGPERSAGSSTPSSSPSPIAPEILFALYSATYRTAGGDTWLVSLQGLLVNIRSGLARELAPMAQRRFSIGPSVGKTEPPDGEASFQVDAAGNATQLDGQGGAVGAFTARRVAYAQREVHFQSGGVTFGATLTEPAGGTNLPAIALVHGSGVQPRPLFSLWANFYASLGFAVLNYDKRGTGESGGTYPGEYPTTYALSEYADDAVAAARYLRGLPEVDPSRVGFHGGSQGGWTVPLALTRAPELSFAILASAPATTVEQTVSYADLSGGSQFVPNLSDAEQDQQTASVTGGYDPAPALRALHVPTLWVYGEKDRQVPVRLSIANIQQLQGKDLTIKVLAGCWHGLTITANGLEKEEATSSGFGAGLFTGITEWARAHRLTDVSP
jgi:dienelactone hydrolase